MQALGPSDSSLVFETSRRGALLVSSLSRGLTTPCVRGQGRPSTHGSSDGSHDGSVRRSASLPTSVPISRASRLASVNSLRASDTLACALRPPTCENQVVLRGNIARFHGLYLCLVVPTKRTVQGRDSAQSYSRPSSQSSSRIAYCRRLAVSDSTASACRPRCR